MPESQYIKYAEEAVCAAAEKLKKARAEIGRAVGVEEGGREVKLLADQVANEILVEALKKTGLPILSEETGLMFGTDRESAMQWVIDPLDGSVNYLRGIGYCAVSVGLCDQGRPVAGVVYDLLRDELVTGIVGRGATAGGRVIAPSRCRDMKEVVLATGFPARMSFDEKNLGEYVKKITAFNKVRMFGSAVQSCLAVADGRMDAYFEQDIMLWDVAAGLALIEASGGCWTWRAGSREFSKVVWACCPGLKNVQML